MDERSVCGSVCGWQTVSERFSRNIGRLRVGLKILTQSNNTCILIYLLKIKAFQNGPMRKKRSESFTVNVWEAD